MVGDKGQCGVHRNGDGGMRWNGISPRRDDIYYDDRLHYVSAGGYLLNGKTKYDSRVNNGYANGYTTKTFVLRNVEA